MKICRLETRGWTRRPLKRAGLSSASRISWLAIIADGQGQRHALPRCISQVQSGVEGCDGHRPTISLLIGTNGIHLPGIQSYLILQGYCVVEVDFVSWVAG